MARKEATFNPLNMTELTRDAFRSLRMNISFSGGDQDVRTLVVTSAVPSEGKTSVSVGIGVSMAESMKNTLIVECDCRRPSVGSRLKKRPAMNWIDVLYQKAPLSEAIVETDCPNLYFLDAEPGLVHSVELLSSGRFREMVEELKKNFDFIIFDTPPLGSFIDAAVLAEHSDGAIVVVKSGSREIRLINQVLEQLKKANAKILGIVLNGVNAHHSSYYKYGDYYYRNRGREQSAKPEKKPVKKAAAPKKARQRAKAELDDDDSVTWSSVAAAARTDAESNADFAGEDARRETDAPAKRRSGYAGDGAADHAVYTPSRSARQEQDDDWI